MKIRILALVDWGRRHGVRNGACEGDTAFLFLISLFRCLLKNVFLLFFFFVFQYIYIFHCWHQFQSLTVDVSSVVGAPWRCGVLTTWGGIAGMGLGHTLERA